MACDFTSFSTLFQSYQDDGLMKIIFELSSIPPLIWSSVLNVYPSPECEIQFRHIRDTN